MAPVRKKGDLNEAEKRLVDHVQKNELEAVKMVLSESSVGVDCLDENGMTPLQHAAYRGDAAVCRLLLDHGADVNDNHHDHRYTALMFAALSGNVQVTRLLLEAGSCTGTQNSVGRTAAQMAAFVGNHACVSVINNYVPRELVEYYSRIQGLETEPKLSPHLVGAVHRLVQMVNVHPLAVVKVLMECPNLVAEHCSSVTRVLDSMCERQFKGDDCNEVLSFKFHYLSRLLTFLGKCLQGSDKTLEDAGRRLSRGRQPDGFPETAEKLVRQTIREFPYPASSMVQQLAHGLARSKIGEEPTALSLVTSAVCGQRMASAEDAQCEACGAYQAQKRCSACKEARYCDQTCQKWHWSTHKKTCSK